MRTILTVSIQEIYIILLRAEDANRNDDYSHTIRIVQSASGAVVVEQLPNSKGCSNLTLLARK